MQTDTKTLKLNLHNALIGWDARAERSNELIASGVWLDPEDLIPTPDNARTPHPDDEGIAKLGRSLSVVQLNSVQARPHPTESGRLDLRAGCRRRAAAISAGIPIRVDIYDWDDDTAYAVTLAENHDREELTVLEEAKLCRVCLERHTVAEATDLLGHSDKWIRRRACLSRLTPEVIEYGGDAWTISYWEAVAMLEPEAQRKLVGQLGKWGWEADRISLSDLRRHCKEHVRILGTKRLWPMDFPWPEPRCEQCTQRKLAVGFLPGFEEDGIDECLNPACYDKRYAAWINYRVEKVLQKHPDAVVIADHKHQDLLTCQAYNLYRYHEDSYGNDVAVPTIVVESDKPVRFQTRYRSQYKTYPDPTASDEKPDGETLKRWQKIRTAVQKLQADLDAAAEGDDDRILPNTFCQGILLVAAAAFGLEGGTYSSRQEDVRPDNGEVIFGHGFTAWHSLEAWARGREDVEPLAADTVVRSLCKTLSARLRIDTLKRDAEPALAEARRVCNFLNVSWGDYTDGEDL